jgi:hypothetical protein
MSRSGNVWDNAAMESFFSSLKTERIRRKTYRTRDEARADVFDYIERFYSPETQAFDDRISEPYGVREPGGISLTWCHSNPVQANQPPLEWSRWNVSLRLAVAPAWPAEPVGVAQSATRRRQGQTPPVLAACIRARRGA